MIKRLKTTARCHETKALSMQLFSLDKLAKNGIMAASDGD